MPERSDLNSYSQRTSVEWIVRKFWRDPRLPQSIADVYERADERVAQEDHGWQRLATPRLSDNVYKNREDHQSAEQHCRDGYVPYLNTSHAKSSERHLERSWKIGLRRPEPHYAQCHRGKTEARPEADQIAEQGQRQQRRRCSRNDPQHQGAEMGGPEIVMKAAEYPGQQSIARHCKAHARLSVPVHQKYR